MKEAPAGDAERAVAGLVIETFPDLSKTCTKGEADGGSHLPMRSSVRRRRTRKANTVEVEPSILREIFWGWGSWRSTVNGEPFCFQPLKSKQIRGQGRVWRTCGRVIRRSNAPESGPDGVLLLITWSVEMGTLMLSHPLVVEERLASVTDSQFQQRHVRAIHVKPPNSRIKLEILPSSNKPGLKNVLPLLGRQGLLGREEVVVRSEPGVPGFGLEVDEGRFGRGGRAEGWKREGVEASGRPEFPRTDET